MPNQEQVKKFIEALEDSGYEPKSYSGRGMFGKECVAVSGKELTPWKLAKALFGKNIPEPREDQLGRGIVLYWPTYEWPKDEDNG